MIGASRDSPHPARLALFSSNKMPQKPPLFRNPFVPVRSLDQRETAARRGYDSAWRRFRASYLSQHPICCFKDHPSHRHECLVVATVVDHVQPLSHGGERLSERNVRPCCSVAHQRVTENLKATGRNEMPEPIKLATGGWF